MRAMDDPIIKPTIELTIFSNIDRCAVIKVTKIVKRNLLLTEDPKRLMLKLIPSGVRNTHEGKLNLN